MKKPTLLFLLTVSMSAHAQQWQHLQNTVPCGPFRDIVKVLVQDQYKETPLWVGQSGKDQTGFTLFVNADKGNFTLVQYYKDTGCILGMGENSHIVNLAPFAQTQ